MAAHQHEAAPFGGEGSSVLDASPLGPATPRPVTPLSILANNLDRLRLQAEALSYTDPAFAAELSETARLANGLEAYLAETSTSASQALQALAAETAQLDWPALHATGETALELEQEMLSGHVEGQLLKMLVYATGAIRILEVGLFTGYSALAMAEALGEGGTLVACEIDPYAAAVARRAFDRSPHGRKIHIEVGPAKAALTRMLEAGARFDFIFIDADKGGYADYFEMAIGGPLIAPGGLVCIDNTLMQGEPYLGVRTPNGRAIAEFNRLVAADRRVEQVLLPIRDGLTLIRRIAS